MNYGVKYILQWEDVSSNAYKIEIQEKNYSGESQQKKLGSAPMLIQDTSDSGISGTSLEFKIQADVNGELESLYTVDPKKYKIIEYCNDSVIWQGYLLPELYSEDYINAPYDISVTATDQLAALKNVNFLPTYERRRLIDIIASILANTGINIGYRIIWDLAPTQDAIDKGTSLSVTYLNDATFEGLTCYEALSQLLSNFNATISQRNNRWYIARERDYQCDAVLLDNLLNPEGRESQIFARIGAISDGENFPVGSLVFEKIAAKKEFQADYTPTVKVSMLKNPYMIEDEEWEKIGGDQRITHLNGEYIMLLSDAIGLQQSMSVEQSAENFSLKFDTRWATFLDSSPGISKNIKLLIKLSAKSGETYYLTAEGWKQDTKPNYIVLSDASSVAYGLFASLPKKQTSEITFTGLPASGVLTVGFGVSSETTWYLYISNVMLTITDVTALTTSVITEINASSKAEDLNIKCSDKYDISNEELYITSTLYTIYGYATEWYLRGERFEKFFNAIIQDYADAVGVVHKEYSGIISGTNLLPDKFIMLSNGEICQIQQWRMDQISNEASVTLRQINTSSAIVEDYEVITDEQQPNVSSPEQSSNIPVNLLLSAENFWERKNFGTTENPIYALVPKDYLGQKVNIVSYGEVSSNGLSDTEADEISGSTVVYTPVLTSGEHIGTIQIDGVAQKIYAPTTDLTGYATENYVNTAIQNAKDTRVDTLINTTIPALEADVAKRALQSSLDTTNATIAALQASHTTLRNEFDALSAVLNDDVSGKINTWNEVVDFLDEYSGSQDLATILSGMNAEIAKRALQTSLDATNANLTALTSRVTTAENNITSVSNRVKTLEDVIGIDANGDVYIKKTSSGVARNFYSYGEVSSGGNSETEGGSGSGGGSTVAWTNAYTSTNGLKIATISIDGVDTSVYTPKSLSAYTNDAGYITSAALNGYATQEWVNNKGYITGITSSMVTTALAYTPFDNANFTKSTIKSTLGISDWALATSKPTYAFSEIAGKPTTLAEYGITDALPLRGGTLYRANTETPLVIKSKSADASGASRIQFIDSSDSHQGYVMTGWGELILAHRSLRQIGVGDSGIWCSTDNGATRNALIHSGNIGGQRVQRAKYLDTLNATGANWYDNQYVIYGQWASETILDWKVDGYEVRVDRAKKLNTARTIWGQSFDGTGNVSGNLHLSNGKLYWMGDSNNYYIGASYTISSTAPNLDYCGYTGHRFIAANTERMRIDSRGNVGIGITSPTYKLHVAGTIYSSSNILAAGEVTSGSDARYKAIQSYVDIDIQTIANAPIINFKWIDREDDKVHLGSTAQYWYNTSLKNGVMPTNDERIWTMGYGQIALAGLVSVAKKVVNHEERIAALEKENRELKQQLNQYRRA